MPRSGGISGMAVSMAAVGGLLAYIGIKGIGLREGLRTFAGGSLPQPQAGSSGAVAAAAATLGGSTTAGTPVGAGAHPEIATAAIARKSEQYSQAKRWQDGYSDCSSFVGKCLKDNGITPPGASVTGDYLLWSKLQKVPRDQVGAGDLLCGVGHMAIALDNTNAIGQQNSRDNVQIAPIDNIMYGQPGWYPQRYVG